MYHYDTCGLDNVFLVNGYDEINTAEGKAVSIHRLDELHQVISENIVNLPRRLNGKEFRFLRIELDMSQKAMGNLMGKKDQSIAKWEKDEVTIPKLADAAIRQLYIESIGKKSKLRAIFDMYNKLDRSQQEREMRFAENEKGWSSAA
jgi:DNA-binding transcriptional regulator YiaG